MEPGDVIYDKGDPATFLFIVIEGDVELTSTVGGVVASTTAHSDGAECDAEHRRMTMRLESVRLGTDGAATTTEQDQQASLSNDGVDTLTEIVSTGSFFGEICLHGPGMEYAESARASGESGCALLVFDREDLARYLGMYMGIIRPHLALETQREILHCLRLHVPWLSSLSYSDMRMLVVRAERLEFESGELLIDGGRLFAPASTASPCSSSTPSQPQQREGLLMLVRGKALITRPRDRQAKPKTHKRKMSRRRSLKSLVSAFAAVIDTDGNFATDSRELPQVSKTNDEDEEALVMDTTHTEDDVVGVNADAMATNSDDGSEDEDDNDAEGLLQEEWWRHADPLTLLPSTTGAVSSRVISLEARSRIECFFLDAAHVAHFAAAPIGTDGEDQSDEAALGADDGTGDEQQNRVKPLLLRKPTHRRSSFAAMHQRLQNSQIITKGLNSASADDEDGEGGDDGRVSTDADDDGGPSRKWRRKKRNKNVLEKALLETKEDADLTSALVLYVLSGANRGDVHVVRNVATLGAIKSGADIELNDRYVSTSHAVIEHHDGRYWLYDDFSEWGTFVRLEENNPVEIHPGDIFLAGEVEFMCLGAFPERKKSLSCCLQ